MSGIRHVKRRTLVYDIDRVSKHYTYTKLPLTCNNRFSKNAMVVNKKIEYNFLTLFLRTLFRSSQRDLH